MQSFGYWRSTYTTVTKALFLHAVLLITTEKKKKCIVFCHYFNESLSHALRVRNNETFMIQLPLVEVDFITS